MRSQAAVFTVITRKQAISGRPASSPAKSLIKQQQRDSTGPLMKGNM